MTKYFVALIEDGIPKFSSRPKAHADAAAADTEVQRLADLYRGKTFQSFSAVPSGYRFTKQPDPPKPVDYSLAELEDPNSGAPAGRYTTGASNVVVIGFNDARRKGQEQRRPVLYEPRYGSLEPLFKNGWQEKRFTPVPSREPISLRVS